MVPKNLSFINKLTINPSQRLVISEGSDYFVSKTKAAVVSFQILYDSEISAVAGYAISHSGFVGTGTRTQLNVLLGR